MLWPQRQKLLSCRFCHSSIPSVLAAEQAACLLASHAARIRSPKRQEQQYDKHPSKCCLRRL